MTRLNRLMAVCALLAAPPAGLAQTTDGYHAYEMLPVVVDSTSFTQRITVRNPDASAVLVSFKFHAGAGTAQAAAKPNGLDCEGVVIPGGQQLVLPSLRSLCPFLVPGSTFGMLVARTGGLQMISLFSRVSNPAGAGFAVEGFALSEFTLSESVVTGLRRSAATASAPAFQTNCFLGQVPRLAPGLQPLPVLVRATAYDASGVELGHLTVSVAPGTLYRLLDVFAAVGAPPGDVVDGSVRIGLEPGTRLTGDGEPPLVGYCTVQDNTSFGADFRIAKQEVNGRGQLGAWASHAQRHPMPSGQIPIPGIALQGQFVIPPGASRNAHVVYFRHPDVVSCALEVVGMPTVSAAYGLEMRLSHFDQAGWRVVAGGNDMVGTGSVFLGDRGSWFDNPYVLEVESNGQNEGQPRPYTIDCRSGSGNTRGEQVLEGGVPQF